MEIVIMIAGLTVALFLFYGVVSFVGFRMTPKNQAVMLELLSGIFGWVWIGACLIAIYQLIWGTWFSFFWWLIISSFSKWQCAVYDHRKQVIYHVRTRP
jgi:hypothetical protein